MLKIAGYSVTETIAVSRTTAVYRAIDDETGSSVVLKTHVSDAPPFARLAKLEREYELLTSVQSRHVVSAEKLLPHGNGLVLVLSDASSVDIKHCIADGKLPSMISVLKIAQDVVAGLSALHQQGIVHRDICPRNLVYNRDCETAQIIDLSISSRLHGRVLHQAPFALAGTLAYIAPEQTGRTSLSVDHRADFYSLGVTLYEMLTNRLPFTSTNPLELIHAHLAVVPEPPVALRAEIPPFVSQMVMHLLEKDPLCRYQDSRSIAADLRAALAFFDHQTPLPEQVGAHDRPLSFEIPTRLYGREAELQTIEDTLRRASHGSSELLLIAGHAGIGKSSLVRAISGCLARDGSGGCLTFGKFDELKRDVPFSALWQAIDHWTRQVLSESEDSVQSWRRRINRALGRDGWVIIDAVPAMADLLGSLPPVPPLAPRELEARFLRVFERFFGEIASAESPLFICLDDLQWAASASLTLVERLLVSDNVSHLVIVGTYRDNEVGPTSALTLALERLQAKDHQPHIMHLSPLTEDALAELLMDTFHGSREDVRELAGLLASRCGGNPMLVSELLTSLVANGLIRRSDDIAEDRARATSTDAVGASSDWHWEFEALRRSPLTANAANIVAQRIGTLPKAHRQALGRAACIGGRFSLALVAELSDVRIGEAARRLQPALQAELLYLDVADENTFFALANDESTLARFAQVDVMLRFAHDRVRQAAHETLDPGETPAIHLRIARLLAARLADSDGDDNLFEALHHYHSAGGIIDDADERLRVAGLCLRGGGKALSSIAYETAGKFCDFGIVMLGEIGWAEQYDLHLQLHLAGAGAGLMGGDLARCDALVTQALQHANTPLDRGSLLKFRVLEYTLQGRFGDATAAGRQALEPFGIALPEVTDARAAFEANLELIENQMVGRSITSLIDLPRLEGTDQQFVAEFLHALNPSSYFTSVELLSWLCSTQVIYSLQHGHGLGSSSGYAAFGNVIGNAFGRHRDAYEFGQLAIELADALSDGSARCTTRLIFAGSLSFWWQPLRTVMPIHEEGVRLGLESGELMFAGYIQQYRIAHAFFLGEPLQQIEQRIPGYARFCDKTNNSNMTDTLDGIQAVIRNLMGKSAEADNFDLPDNTEAALLQAWAARHSAMALPKFFVLKALVLLLYGDVDGAFQATEQARKGRAGIFGAYASVELSHITTLVLIRQAERSSGPDRAAKMDAACTLQAQMRKWADNCPDNFETKWHLAQAEWSRVNGDHWQAAIHYDRALHWARSAQQMYSEAMAHELAGTFWLQADCTESGQMHLDLATQLYHRWGAQRKVDRLRVAYPFLSNRGLSARATTGTINEEDSTWEWNSDNSFTAASIVKLTRALSSSLVRDDLQEKLLRLATESVGATRGCLLGVRDDAWVLEAELDVAAQRMSLTAAAADTVAQTVVNYVRSRQQPVVLTQGSHFERASSDRYLQAHPRVAIVCVPIVKQESTVAVLYLENDLVPGVFRLEHVKMLQILSNQAAVSLENARLYRRMKLLHADLQRRYEQIERANRVRSEFVASMSHELRTPLNALINIPATLLSDFANSAVLYCTICDDEYELPESGQDTIAPRCPECDQPVTMRERMLFVGDDDEHHELLGKLMTGSEEMLQVVSELLDFSDIESDSIHLILKPVTVTEILDSVADKIADMAAAKRIEVIFERSTAQVTLVADRAKLIQIVFNVVENAVKFTAAGGTVRVAVKQTTRADKDLIYVTVDDTGIGIPSEKLEEVFESFRQLESSHTRDYGGTGLGLAITKKLVELHDGTIWATSHESQGSTFHIELPVIGPTMSQGGSNAIH